MEGVVDRFASQAIKHSSYEPAYHTTNSTSHGYELAATVAQGPDTRKDNEKSTTKDP